VSALRSQPFDVRLKLLYLCLQTLAMRSVLRGVDPLSLEGGVFRPEGIHFATESIMLGFYVFPFVHDVFPFVHVQILARCVPPRPQGRPWRVLPNFAEP
jgi:hypothetical protein